MPAHEDSKRFAGSVFAFQSGTFRMGIVDIDFANDRVFFWVDNTTAQVAHNVPSSWAASHQLHADFAYKVA